MKILELLEDSFDNIELAKDMADVAFNYLWPLYLKSGKTVEEMWKWIPGSDEIDKKYNNYSAYNIDNPDLSLLNIRLDADKPSNRARGVYNYKKPEIVVFLQNTIKVMPGIDNKLDHWQVKSVLIHEFRHAIQFEHYPTYANSPDANKPHYDERPIELDAKWTETVGQYSPLVNYGQYSYPQWIIQVMKRWKKLAPKTEKQYYKKTVDYAANYSHNVIKRYWQKALKDYFLNITNFDNNGKFHISQLVKDVDDNAMKLIKRSLTQKEIMQFKIDARNAYMNAKKAKIK